MASLNVACVLRRKSFSSTPSMALNCRIGGTVASPTPTVPISGDSITVIAQVCFSTRESAAAAIHPAVPPPRIAMRRMGSVGLISSGDHLRRRAILRDKGLVRRRRFRGAADERAHVLHVRADILSVVLIDQRVV